jgi:hypothetical protein
MNEQMFLKGQRVISPEGEGEVVDAIGEEIEVKLDKGEIKKFSWDELTDNNDAG